MLCICSPHFLVFGSSVVIWYGRIPLLRKWCTWVITKLSYRNLYLRRISNHILWMSIQQTQHLQSQCAALHTLELLTCAWKYHNLDRELSSVAEFLLVLKIHMFWNEVCVFSYRTPDGVMYHNIAVIPFVRVKCCSCEWCS